MTIKLKLTVTYGLLSFILCVVTPWAVAAVISSVALFAFVLWSERFTEDQSKSFENKLKELESRVNNLNLSKSLGR
jgi:hypothetical protein